MKEQTGHLDSIRLMYRSHKWQVFEKLVNESIYIP